MVLSFSKKELLLYFLVGIGCGIAGFASADKKRAKEEEEMRTAKEVRPEYIRQSVADRNASVRPYNGHRATFDAQPMNYTTVDPAELQSPPEDDYSMSLEEEARADEEWARKMTERAEYARGRKPRIISADAMGDLDATWDNQTLYYYAGNDVLTTENGEVIEDVYQAIGDALDKYGFAEDGSQREVIVQNFNFGTVYEVVKVFGNYDEY